MRKGFLYEEMRKCGGRQSYIYDFAADLSRISLYMRKILFPFFISVCTWKTSAPATDRPMLLTLS